MRINGTSPAFSGVKQVSFGNDAGVKALKKAFKNGTSLPRIVVCTRNKAWNVSGTEYKKHFKDFIADKKESANKSARLLYEQLEGLLSGK